MNFGELLHTAHKNGQDKKEIKYYSTKFAPPKKEQKTKMLSVNVQKFLARKEAEEKVKLLEAKEKRNQLLELRSKDKKATRRVNVMLKRTKSANQSVIEDALDNDNTAVTLAGPSQPDEDDYGYVSQEAASFYNKMMEKYSKMPEKPKFPLEKKRISTNLSSTKDRVKAALDKEREDAMLPHRRKRKHAEVVEPEKDAEDIPEVSVKKEISRSKVKAPPPMNFMELLKIAEKKQFEPIVIEQKKEDKERPLTKKQRKEFEREQEWRERKESQNKLQTTNRIPKLNSSGLQQNDQKQSKSNGEIVQKKTAFDLAKNRNITNNHTEPSQNIQKKQLQLTNDKISERKAPSLGEKNNYPGNLTSKSILQDKLTKDKVHVNGDREMSSGTNTKKLALSRGHQLQSKHLTHHTKERQSTLNSASSNDFRNKQFPLNDKTKMPPPDDRKSKQLPNVTHKQLPSKSLNSNQYIPGEVRRKECSTKDVKRKALVVSKGRILDDGDEDYDSEMDDFIDDGPEEGEDYSKYISEIFGYDKNKYRNVVEDDDNMESTFAQQMKEEVISTKLGIMEDLEDMKIEEEAKKRKALLKKRKK